MKLIVLSLLMAVPTPPGFLLLVFLVSFFIIHDFLKIAVDIFSETW